MEVYPWVLQGPVLAWEAVAKLERAAERWRTLATDAWPATSEDATVPGVLAVAAALDGARIGVLELAEALQRHATTPAPDLSERLAELAEADGRCRRAVEAATALLPASGAVSWWPGDSDLLSRRLAGLHPLAAGDPDSVRQQLRDADIPTLRLLLAVRPDLADALSRAESDQVPPQLVRALRGGPARVHAAFSGCDPLVATRWALLWPRVLGSVDGVPPPLRYEANRMLLRATLAGLRGVDRGFDDALVAHGARVQTSWWRRVGHAVREAWDSREVLTQAWSPSWRSLRNERSQERTRVRLIESILHGREPALENRPATGCNTAPQLTPAAHRQVLSYDDQWPGRLVEVRGQLGVCTRHLVIVVPGTGTTVTGFHMPSQFAADLVAADAEGRIAAVTWMGCEFPRALGNQATLARYARAGAQPLCDTVDGLLRWLLAQGQAVDVTVIGHSYGGVIVGAAERRGLAVDKVIHLASAGAGPGVRTVADYAATDTLGRPRAVRRWVMTAPGDPIRWARRLLPRLPPIDLGVDPAELSGVGVLQAGHWERDVDGHRQGDPVTGTAGHGGVANSATSGFRRIVEVITQTGVTGTHRGHVDPPRHRRRR